MAKFNKRAVFGDVPLLPEDREKRRVVGEAFMCLRGAGNR
jgi:hypothetical protein